MLIRLDATSAAAPFDYDCAVDPQEAAMTTGGGPPRDGATAMMAGFIAWLAARHFPEQHEEAILQDVESFLIWYDASRLRRRDGLKRSCWAYLNQLQESGGSDAELQTTWAALRLLLTYDDQHP